MPTVNEMPQKVRDDIILALTERYLKASQDYTQADPKLPAGELAQLRIENNRWQDALAWARSALLSK